MLSCLRQMSFAFFQSLTFKHVFLIYSVVLGLTVFECSRELRVTTTFICKISNITLKLFSLARLSVSFSGCGNSALSYDMYQAGYTSITNVDYSSICVESMAERHKDCAQLSWLCMDARRLAFPDGVFDVVLEKGTLDAMLVEESDPWKVSENAAKLLHQVLLEVRNNTESNILTLKDKVKGSTFSWLKKSLYF